MSITDIPESLLTSGKSAIMLRPIYLGFETAARIEFDRYMQRERHVKLVRR